MNEYGFAYCIWVAFKKMRFLWRLKEGITGWNECVKTWKNKETKEHKKEKGKRNVTSK
jgi:hypothetical protein